MVPRIRLVFLLLASTALAACGVSPQSSIAPSDLEMRKALKVMLKDRPEISIPEFQEPLDKAPAIASGDTVFIGPWNLYPDLLSFEVVFTAPNVSFYEIAGRFEQDAAGTWRAYPRRIKKTVPHEIGPYWRQSEVDPF